MQLWVEILFWRYLLICWIESVDNLFDLLNRVCRPRCWFVSNKSNFVPNNFIQCCWMLLNSNKSLKCKIITLKCFSKMWLQDLNTARKNSKCCQKMTNANSCSEDYLLVWYILIPDICQHLRSLAQLIVNKLRASDPNISADKWK